LLQQIYTGELRSLEFEIEFQIWWPPIWHRPLHDAPLTHNTPDAAGGFESGFREAALGAVGSGGQTREHAQLAKSLGVDQLAVVVSKLDTCGFSQDRFEEIRSARVTSTLLGCPHHVLQHIQHSMRAKWPHSMHSTR